MRVMPVRLCFVQVLDDNPYAQRSRHQAASSAGPMAEPMEVEEPPHVETTHVEHAETVVSMATIQQQQRHRDAHAAQARPIVAQPDQAAGGHISEHASAAEEPRQASSEAGAAGSGAAASMSQAADAEEAKRGKKKVRFQEPWAPPHRREGQPPRLVLPSSHQNSSFRS